jgi:hypothetical protein
LGGFVTEAQPTTAFAQPLCQLQQDLDAVLDNKLLVASVLDFTSSSGLSAS